ncbi:MAG TPA: hypothetical protein DCQ98_18020 [Planctomycetaceae bacterium]|nr:hypothetical protein [Planctomycetaceae bacterium]HRF02875.1 FeoB-associated Cys-rich membrane protein [Pirellulaceae bacterium]
MTQPARLGGRHVTTPLLVNETTMELPGIDDWQEVIVGLLIAAAASYVVVSAARRLGTLRRAIGNRAEGACGNCRGCGPKPGRGSLEVLSIAPPSPSATARQPK